MEAQKPKVEFYPIPEGTVLTLESKDEQSATVEELISVLMHLSINREGQKVKYWIQLEGLTN